MVNNRNLVVNSNAVEVDPETGEVMNYAPSTGPLVESRSRIVGPDYKRELQQFKNLGEDVREDDEEEVAFNKIRDGLYKIISYDGLPSEPLKEHAGKCIEIAGAVIYSQHTFTSKTIIDEQTGQPAIMEGYDKLLLKVVARGNTPDSMRPCETDDADFLILETSAKQPKQLFEAMFNQGIAPGDFPGTLVVRIFQSGQTVRIGLAK